MDIFLSLSSAIATVLTGGVAIWIYFTQKKDSKKQAARVLLTEIRIAEERIDQIRDKIINNSTMDLPSVFTTDNWKKYAHLFISNFDQDELKLINSFYDYGQVIEDFAKRNNNYFWLVTEERAKVSVAQVATFISNSYGLTTPDDDVLNRKKYLEHGLDEYNSMYSPQKTLNGIKDYLPKVPKITTSSCGIKLKKIANL
jgi:hypothetical protein